MAEIYVGMGSNVEPEEHLKDAVAALQKRLGTVELSSVYRNPAVGFAGDDFLNLVLCADTHLAPAAVERVLSEIETAAGRGRSRSRVGPRTLDLDLLLYGNLVDPALRLPRGDILRYAFVLRPLAELAPALTHPVTGTRMEVAWRRMAEHSPPMEEVGGVMSPPADAGHGAGAASE